MRQIALALALVALIIGVASAAQSTAAAPSDITRGGLFRAYLQNEELSTRFLERRVRLDPQDITALNRLAGLYLRKMRETGSIDYLLLAGKRAGQSLATVPADQNTDALRMLGRVQFESHEFVAAREAGLRLTVIAPDKVGSFALLGDALLELGDYEGAAAAYERMRRLDEGAFDVLCRFGRLSLLQGDPTSAAEHFEAAIQRVADSPEPMPDVTAWCRWQLGEVLFSTGQYEAAERQYSEALSDFPGYFRALGSMGRVRAALGDVPSAISWYQKAIAVFPDPTFVAALGDLDHLSGREREARQQYDLVEKIAKLSAFNGVLYNRPLAMFFADHGMRPLEAYEAAASEYQVRKDVYGADALAWTALAAGKLSESRTAAQSTLRLGTRDARVLYHCGMIDLAAGDRAAAAKLLGRAIALNPHFDPLQAPRCMEAMKNASQSLH